MHTSEYDYLFKLLLIGDSGVGKVRCYCADEFQLYLTSWRFTVLSPHAFRGRPVARELY